MVWSPEKLASAKPQTCGRTIGVLGRRSADDDVEAGLACWDTRVTPRVPQPGQGLMTKESTIASSSARSSGDVPGKSWTTMMRRVPPTSRMFVCQRLAGPWA